ncbi:MAG: TIGR04282 family arsenosugar biosynthesis glycosyltransferase [Crocinitomicaceae bacterium]|nr:TIGR04282 family arsenosugar biosynthesis glycosyltransferase [Crocinitomicaceae bacterium]MDG1776537.1 TIGR04282 family arsenosugar biosynthesis glycosyltransferase [Crocinitomicaceae bacterium]
MSENLIIVFAKNRTLGKVKTRLAKTIGDHAALEVYTHLFNITQQESIKTKHCDLHIYYSDVAEKSSWSNAEVFIQTGDNIGERMMNAFDDGFSKGYKRIVGIGSDLPDLKSGIMETALKVLETSDTVFGPSEDGGYYLIGMTKSMPFIFLNKPWSTDQLLNITVKELKEKKYSVKKLMTLNDIDDINDLKRSSISKLFQHLYSP